MTQISDNAWYLNVIKQSFYLLLFILATACVDHTVKLPEGYLTPEEMVPIVVDMHLVEGARSGKLVLGDTNKLPDYYAKVYEKHDVTEQQFKESFKWYTKHPEELKKIYEAAIEKLSILEAEIKANGSKPVKDSE